MKKKKPAKRRPGRPRRDHHSRTLPTLAFRPSQDTRELVERAAQEAGHSLSAEIDRRLRQSYWQVERYREELERAFGGNHNFILGFLMARIATGVEHRCGMSWQSSPLVWREVATAVVAVLQRMRGLPGAEELPLTREGEPNPLWPVLSASDAASDELWFQVVREIASILSTGRQLHWPLLDTLTKKSHDDYSDEFVPSPAELRKLYNQVGVTVEVSNQA